MVRGVGVGFYANWQRTLRHTMNLSDEATWLPYYDPQARLFQSFDLVLAGPALKEYI